MAMFTFPDRCRLLLMIWLCATGTAAIRPAVAAEAVRSEDKMIADSLASMLQAARSVISDSQPLINDPSVGNKGLTGKVVLARTLAAYRATTGSDPPVGDPNSRAARLMRDQTDAIVEVVDANQDTINAAGTGFKGLVPATFARLVNEAFARRAGAEASVKVTAPPEFVRYLKALPDAFEASVIRDRFLAPGWPRGQSYEAVVDGPTGPEFRMQVPEYYTASCLACHGSPKGSLDITGYPREGGKAGDLGGVISITLAH